MTKYKLFRAEEFVMSGDEDTIQLYLRLQLDKWEDLYLMELRKALTRARDDINTIKQIDQEMRNERQKAFRLWKEELKRQNWYVGWYEEKTYREMYAFKFFLKDLDTIFISGNNHPINKNVSE